MKRRRIGVTGYKGMIGQNLLPILDKDYDVIGWDIKEGHNIFDIKDIFGIDTIVHLAALTNVNQSFTEASKYFYTNVLGTAKMVEMCIGNNTHLIYPSSAAVFDPESSPYAMSKYVAEQVVGTMSEVVPTVVFTLFNVYSDKPAPGSLFYNFLHDEKITINGDGKQTRDFINVKDVCKIINLAIKENWMDINMEVGMGKSVSINTVAKIFQKYTKKEIIYVDEPYGIRKSKAESIVMDELIPFDLETNLEEDIKNMIMKFN